MLNVFKSKKFRFLGRHARYLSHAWKVAGSVLRTWVFLAFATGTVFAADAPGLVPAERHSSPCLMLLDARHAVAVATRPAEDVSNEQTTVTRWPDTSGRGHHATQTNAAAEPQFIGRGSAAAVRFDGVAAHLQASLPSTDLTRWTLFAAMRPLSNRGGFRGIAAGGRRGQNDYTSGFNVDFGSPRSRQFDLLNVEGPGFSGQADLCGQGFVFGQPLLLTVTARPGEAGVQVFVDGVQVGSRLHAGAAARLEDLVIGGRLYDNSGKPPQPNGFFHGDIAELRIYDEALPDEERIAVETTIRKAHADFFAETVAVAGPPFLERVSLETGRIFSPGFQIEPLPLDLPNLNALCYRHDGVLVAGGYDGTVWLLTDSDGNGLEDTAREYFKSPTIKAVMGMAVTPKGDPRGDGVFVVTVGRVVFIPDADGDGRGDREQVIAEGWPDPAVSAGGVSDAMGAALGPDGSLFFGLGTPNFTNAYLLDEHGTAAYDPAGERGTIQRISPDFSSRETVCTGTRFTFGMAFDADGQLFCTDQEGATWLANGNPFDELHAIQTGRHYGFPPRHPQHLPDVIDEPSLFDFRPQHQSTCGLLFNEPNAACASCFGPAWWQGSAIICGESRGRLFRVEVLDASSDHDASRDYLARGHVLGTLAMMPIDAAISPRGDLIVACHSGAPDWGSGPAGRGRLYRIRYTDQAVPQPRFAYTPSPHEVRIVFDRPVPPAWLARTARESRITCGLSVSAGDRFEQFRPGYSVVAIQEDDPRSPLPVHGVQLSPDGRTVILATAPHRANVPHALSVAVGEPASDATTTDTIDLVYQPHGVLAEWHDASGELGWTGWLPTADTVLARHLTAGSPHHDELWQRVEEPGSLHLTTTLDLTQMLRPQVQRDLALDHTRTDEIVSVAFTGTSPLEPQAMSGSRLTIDGNSLTLTTPEGVVPVTLVATTAPGFQLTGRWHTEEDSRPRVLPLHRFLLPWARETDAPAAPKSVPADLVGGDWTRGRDLFFGDEATCSRCHTIDGRGGWIGPDLSNLRARDHRAVRRDITDPNATLNPEHLAHVLTLDDGRVLSGIVRPRGDTLELGLIDGTVLSLDAGSVEAMQPSAVSIMPTGLAEKLGEDRMRDLLVFLTMSPPERHPAE